MSQNFNVKQWQWKVLLLMLIFILPLAIYFWRFWLEPVSKISSDWSAFGQLFYGLALVSFGAVNVWLYLRVSKVQNDLVSRGNEIIELGHINQINLQRGSIMITALNEFVVLKQRYKEMASVEKPIGVRGFFDELEKFYLGQLSLFSSQKVHTLAGELNSIANSSFENLFNERSFYIGPPKERTEVEYKSEIANLHYSRYVRDTNTPFLAMTPEQKLARIDEQNASVTRFHDIMYSMIDTMKAEIRNIIGTPKTEEHSIESDKHSTK